MNNENPFISWSSHRFSEPMAPMVATIDPSPTLDRLVLPARSLTRPQEFSWQGPAAMMATSYAAAARERELAERNSYRSYYEAETNRRGDNNPFMPQDNYARLIANIMDSKTKTNDAIGPKEAAPTVEEIHRAFETESERALTEAKSILARSADAIAKRLKTLGFAKHPRVQQNDKSNAPLERATEAEPFIERYKAKYGKAFILREQAIRLAQKYGLVLGRVSEFIGNVPETNVEEIERFMEKFDRADAAYGACGAYGDFAEDAFYDQATAYTMRATENDTMMIVAPLKDFDMKSTRAHVDERGVMVNDPIVLYPAVGGYIVVTAWGDEANDPLLTQ